MEEISFSDKYSYHAYFIYTTKSAQIVCRKTDYSIFCILQYTLQGLFFNTGGNPQR